MKKTLIAAGVLLAACSTAAFAQDNPEPTVFHGKVNYPSYYDQEFRLMDPQSSATATGADEVSREDTKREAKPQIRYPHRTKAAGPRARERKS